MRIRATVEHMSAQVRNSRPITMTREGSVIVLTFAYDPDLIEKVKQLPYSRFDSDSRCWRVDITSDAVSELRRWHSVEGLTDVSVDQLIEGETPPATASAVLRPGSTKRPYVVVMSVRDDSRFARLRAINGAQWEKKVNGLSYPSAAAPALQELVDKQQLHDPDNLLQPAAITVTYDTRDGSFKVRGDERAMEAFRRNFPGRDIVGVWQERGFEVAFSDSFSEEVYRSELARDTQLHPEGLKEALFPYQAESIALAVQRTGFAVWDQPGLGKTATAIGWAWELMRNRKEADRCVVVVPGAVKTQFAREIERFCGEKAVVIEGDRKQRHALYELAESSSWVVLNYDLLHLDLDSIETITRGALLVADEAHRLKNRTSKRTRAMRQIARGAHRRLALSGTPVENNPAEWYTLMNGFVVPGMFGSPQDFLGRYCYPGRFGGYEGARNLQELATRSRPHYIRHLKSEVAQHLPPLMVENVVLDPDEKLASALRRAHQDAAAEISEAAKGRVNLGLLDGERADEIESGAAMTAVGMLRLMCSSPRLVHMSGADAAEAMRDAGLSPDSDGPKLDELRARAKHLQQAGERAIVFTSFRTMANLIAERMEEDGIRYVMYTGSSSNKEREDAVERFTTASEEGPTLFIATDAASEGLNLGQQCSTLINFDLAFKPSTMIQRANRIHRVDGQTGRRYRVTNLTIANTIEEGIIRMVGHKADLSDAILGESGTRRQTTGRKGRNMFEEALKEWNR